MRTSYEDSKKNIYINIFFMDLTAFSHKSFNVKDWINKVFEQEQCQDKRDNYASSLILKLQLAIQDINNGLEEASAHVVSTLPRILRDVECISHEANVLQTQMANIQQQIQKVEQSTANSMKVLVKLDNLKGKLTASSQALKEADNWTTLSADIEEVFDSGDLVAISEKLTALQSCLSILSHVPDYHERVAHLESLKVRLEALASPYIVAAFKQHNFEDSCKYYSMLRTVGRCESLESYYHKCEVQELTLVWRSGVEGHHLSGPPIWLSAFYDHLITLITKQLKWCTGVFVGSNPTFLLTKITNSTFLCLDPSINDVVNSAIKQQEEPLTFLLAIKNAGDMFLKELEEKIKTNDMDDEMQKLQREIVRSVYSPLKDQLGLYCKYEEAFLLSHITDAQIMQDDIADSLQHCRDYCAKMSKQAETVANRCIQLSSGFHFVMVVNALETYVRGFNECLSLVSRHIEQQTPSIQDDWTIFNTCLCLIQAAGEFAQEVDSMEHIVGSVFATNVSKMEWEEDSFSFSVTPQIMLSKDQLEEIKELINRVVDSNGLVLDSSASVCASACQQSVSVALNTIIAPVSFHLTAVPQLQSWHTNYTASVSAALSPQEYVTQIGQYLMTLPQHLEPLFVTPNQALNRALQESSAHHNSGRHIVSESEGSAADFLIASVGHNVCQMYCDVIIRIPKVAPNMVTQLITDIDYVCNILDDLGVTTCDPLSGLLILLKTPAEELGNKAQEVGAALRHLEAIRQIRGLHNRH